MSYAFKERKAEKKIGLNEIKPTTSTKSYGVPKCRNYFISQFFLKRKSRPLAWELASV